MKVEAYECDLCGKLFKKFDREFGFTHTTDKVQQERLDYCPDCMQSHREWREERKRKGIKNDD